MGWLIHSYNALISFLSNPIAYLFNDSFQSQRTGRYNSRARETNPFV